MRGFFVTSTDRGVGQTTVAGALSAAAAERGERVAVMAPVEIGCPLKEDQPTESARIDALFGAPAELSAFAAPEKLIPEAAVFLREMSGCDRPLDLVNPYRYGAAVPPLLAAEIASRPIELDQLIGSARELSDSAELLVVDPPRLMTPISAGVNALDLAEQLDLVTIVVCPPRSDAIDHVALVLAALASKKTKVGGVVINCTTEERRPEEAAAPRLIDEYTSSEVVGALPWYSERERADRAFLARSFSRHVDLDRLIERL